MAQYDKTTRQAISKSRNQSLNQRIQKLDKKDKLLAKELIENYKTRGELIGKVAEKFYTMPHAKPSSWFQKHAITDVFVPEPYRESFFYIIDKLNRFPFSSGWNRRTVRTAGYGPQIRMAFSILKAYENLRYCDSAIEDFMLGRLDEEKMDYIRNLWDFDFNFNFLYAAEIDRGNQNVIQALKDFILSENNTAYLNREMILGILRSDNVELHKLLCDLLLAARLQEGLRQCICETMDQGTEEAFLMLLQTIEAHDLIRYSSVKRSVSTWIGIFDKNSVDRINGKLLTLMGQCLRNREFLTEQLKTNDSIAISTALWALGFHETNEAVEAIMKFIDTGTKNQKLTASFYNQTLYDPQIRRLAAKKVMLEYYDDLELVAAFLPAFSSNLNSWIQSLLNKEKFDPDREEKPQKPILTNYFQNRAEAEELYDKFLDVYHRIPKKGLIYNPCIFPWYQVTLSPSDLIRLLAFIAYVLEDEEKITQAAGFLGNMSGTYGRSNLLTLLLYRPTNRTQKELLLQYMGLTEEYASQKAISLVKKLSLEDQDYLLLEDMLRFKRSNLRAHLLEMLMKQEDEAMNQCIKRLLEDKKEEKRTAGLDLLLRLSKVEKKKAFYEKVKPMASLIQNPTDKEQILIQEILGQEISSASTQKGFGIYDPDVDPKIPEQEGRTNVLVDIISLTEDETIGKIKKLENVILANKDYEYESISGDKQLVGNFFWRLKGSEEKRNMSYCLKNYPLEKELREFYEQEIGDYRVFLQMEARMLLINAEMYQNAGVFYQTVFGKMPFQPKPMNLEYSKQLSEICLIYHWEFLDKKLLLKTGIQMANMIAPVINKYNKEISYYYEVWKGRRCQATSSLNRQVFFQRLFEGLGYWETDEEFTQAFFAAWKIEMKCLEEREQNQFCVSVNGLNARSGALTHITPYWFLKAYHMNLISWDILCKAILNYFHRGTNLYALTQLVKGEYSKPSNRDTWNQFFGGDIASEISKHWESLVGPKTWCGAVIQKLYDAIVPVIVDIELRRGEAETPFSFDVSGISYIQGIPYLIRILMALGKDPLAWYYSSNNTKREVLSHLLQACYPREKENGKDLQNALKNTQIKADRLVEVAMYAPQWIDIIQDCLGWKGLKSGCYYFMAHMDEWFDEQKKAIIAKYTPLSEEELQAGAFDIDWFQECYELLGEKNFSLLYKAAKYISNGQKHSRARKYADAATGKVTLEALQTEIQAKRNKDLLMSYGLVPFMEKKERDILDRYQLIQNYSKEARQFGAQRRAKETKAAQIALVNLSVHAGFENVQRLILKMESSLVREFSSYMTWTAVEDVEICLQVNEEGKSQVLCRKNGKMLKSIPSRLKKNSYVLEIKDAHKKLKDQQIRAKSMMEESMEKGESFTAGELAGLMENPVIAAILSPLVFVCGEHFGFLSVIDGQSDKNLQGQNETLGSSDKEQTESRIFLTSCNGITVDLQEQEQIRIAHPLDLYRSNVWQEYQKYLFEHQIRQPLKQVFRELYLKLPEELGLQASRMFAGNQIQPQKTVGCLRSRRWVADYEEGLQKVFYKENIIARIYALADWFCPSDIEAPVLEWVEFFNRKTFEPLTIEQVPDLIYSEVMRDVDLAVSVAHAGGVDPETSHSTIEMRRAILTFNLPLFGLKNVILKDSHALIEGSRGAYTVHLGSGVIHQKGGAMLNILPVHSQKRGKLFLPFVDEDPKTAEIMSKIVLLAEDKKIKDPFILDQIFKA